MMRQRQHPDRAWASAPNNSNYDESKDLVPPKPTKGRRSLIRLLTIVVTVLLLSVVSLALVLLYGDFSESTYGESTLKKQRCSATRYIHAYEVCCGMTSTSTPTSNLNCTKEDNNWFIRLMNKKPLVSSGKATLYWAHMRKAGGTTFSSSIESHVHNTTADPSATFTNGFVRTIKVHSQAGSRHCVNHRLANETLFVTIFRDPIDRYTSEYFYNNVPSFLKSTTTKGRIIEWWKRTPRDERGFRMNLAKKSLIENWQTRWYTHPDGCKDLNRPQPNPKNEKYMYESAGYGLDPRQVMTRQDLEDAKMVIDQFDIVGIAPFFEEEHSILPWLELAGSNKVVQISKEAKNKNEKKPLTDSHDVKTNLTMYFYDQFRLDLELFQFAKDLSRRRTAISNCVKNIVG